MILASFYIGGQVRPDRRRASRPSIRSIAYWTIAISIVGILLVFIPAWLGIRLGAMFATVLGLLSMIPLTFLAIAPDLPAVGGRLGPAVRVPAARRHGFFSAQLRRTAG